MDLQAISVFIKDWIPPIGIIAGGLWVFYRWAHTERLRRLKERSAVEGDLTYEVSEISDTKCFVIFNARWDNKSPFPFEIDAGSTGLDIFKLDGDTPIGALDLRIDSNALGKPVVELKPYKNLKSLLIEPNTRANFQHMAILEKGNVHLARYKLYRKTEKGKFSRSRFCLCDLR